MESTRGRAQVPLLLVVLSVVVVLGLGARTAPPGDPAVALPVAPSGDPAVALFATQLGARFYGLYRDGHKVGFLQSTFARGVFRGAPVLRVEGRAQLTVLAGGQRQETVLETLHLFAAAAPYPLLRLTMASEREGAREETELRAGPGGWVAATRRGKEPERVRTVDVGDYTLRRFLAVPLWVAGGPALGDEVATAQLDTGTLAVRPASALVVGVVHTVIDAVPDRITSVASFADGAETVTRYDGVGRILAVEGGEVDVRWEIEAAARDLGAPADLFLDALIPVSPPLADPQGAARLVLLIPPAAAALLPTGAGQTLGARLGDDRVELLLTKGGRVAASLEEAEAALRAERDFPTGEPRVLRLLKETIPPRTNPEATVRLLVAFVRDYLVDDRAAEPLDLAAVIDGRRGDCTEHTALFVTLARAAGIPARGVGGLAWVDGLRALGGHAWAEVALDGRWVAVDPIFGQFPADAARIRLPEAPGAQSAARKALKAGGVELLREEP